LAKQLGQLFEELRRRNVLRIGIAYLAFSWLLIQVADTIFPAYSLPRSALTVLITILAIGFVPTLVLAWTFDLTPEGVKRDKNVGRSTPVSVAAGKKLDRLIVVVLVLALGYFAVDKFVLDPARDAAREEAIAGQARSDALLQSNGDKSIVVLPFVNMSDDVSNEYFSDGISEELINSLAQFPDLRVISRSSAFSFKGKDVAIPAIAQHLNVSHVLEGSVRKAGNRIRITAQLIEAHSDTHLWSQTFDRELGDVFGIQDEIAGIVVDELKIKLLDSRRKQAAFDPEAYSLFLKGRYLRLQKTPAALREAEVHLQQALAITPDYAEALNVLGAVYFDQANLGLRPFDEGFSLAREAIGNALEIDPEISSVHNNLAYIAMVYDQDLATAARHVERGLQLAPVNTGIMATAASLNYALGRLDEAIRLNEFIVVRDPISPARHANLGVWYTAAGRWDEAVASLRTALLQSPSFANANYAIGVALLHKGEPEAALEAMQRENSSWRLDGLPLVYHALGRTEEADAVVAELIENYAQSDAYNIAYITAYRGQADRAFEWLERAVLNNDPGLPEILGERLFSNIHDDPRWLPFLASIGKAPNQLAEIEFNVTLPVEAYNEH
jgi:adenylate cyclase